MKEESSSFWPLYFWDENWTNIWLISGEYNSYKRIWHCKIEYLDTRWYYLTLTFISAMKNAEFCKLIKVYNYQPSLHLFILWVSVLSVLCDMFHVCCCAGVLCWLINGRYYPINPREREIFLGDTKIADKFWYGSAKISNVDDCRHDPLQLSWFVTQGVGMHQHLKMENNNLQKSRKIQSFEDILHHVGDWGPFQADMQAMLDNVW